MTQTNYYPQVKLNPGEVNLHSIVHGRPGFTPPDSIITSLGKRIETFRPQDYLLIEGSPYEFFIGDTREGPGDPMIQFLLHVPQINGNMEHWDKRTERPEFYLDTILRNPVDQIISPFYLGAGEDPSEPSTIYEHGAYLEANEAEAYKKARIDALVGKIEGVSREEIALFAEKVQTLRSILLARTASYRATALGSYPDGGKVKLFEGWGHTGESLKYMRSPRAVESYLAGAHEDLRDIYERNEEVQKEITETFHQRVRGRNITPEDRTLALIDIVYAEFEGIMRKITPDHIPVVHIQ